VSVAGLRERLGQPTDAAGLAAFRILFGLVVVFSTARFWALGWIESLWLQPRFHFTWAGFDWVEPLPGPWMYVVEAVLLGAAVALALGWRTRVAAAVVFVLFTYGELIDKALYLNHYYLVSLLALLCVWLPVGAAWSLDARRVGERPVPLGAYVMVRSQIACVYVFAGLAKLSHDWLVLGEPLRTWLQIHHDWWLVGPLLDRPETALAMSWLGMLHDLLIIPALLWRRTRAIAFAIALAFHLSIWLLFPIGVFSLVMLAALTICFAPSWPRRLTRRLARLARRALPSSPTPTPTPPPRPRPTPTPTPRASTSASTSTSTSTLALALAALYLTLQLLLPLRHLAYPGDVNWTEQGFRFAWRVMLIEKTGHVELSVTTHDPTRHFAVLTTDDLTPLQAKMMSTQPDMIHDYAWHLADGFAARGYTGIEVRADAWVALNGRPSQRIIDPDADLVATPRGPWPKPWILPLAE